MESLDRAEESIRAAAKRIAAAHRGTVSATS
jgi:hypothetical protein